MFIKTAAFHQHHGLSILQLVSSEVDTVPYISINTAMQKGFVEVKEVSESGSVNLLFIENKSREYVFIMDGDILAGAKQNRVVNTSILLQPNAAMKIPVSCVERGRWNFVSDKFKETNYSAPMSIRSSKGESVHSSLRESRGFVSDQGGVWENVDAFQYKHNVSSATSNLSDVFDRKMITDEEIKKYFPFLEGASGLAVFFGNEFMGMDLFNRRDIYDEYYFKIVKSAVLESQVSKKKKKIVEPKARFVIEEMVDEIQKLERERYPAVSAGSESRFATPKYSGFSLEYEQNTIHMTAMKSSGSKPKSTNPYNFNITE